MSHQNVSEITGCPFADARGAGLELHPRLNCGPAHLEGCHLVWDPSQPVRVQLRELSEQTAKWRNRRGLHIVHTPKPNEGVHDETADHEPGTGTVRVFTDPGGARSGPGLRDSAHPSNPADWVQNDAPGVRMRRARKLPLGV